LVLFLAVFPFLVNAQTIGGRSPLNSTTFAFLNETTDLAPTVLFTPPHDSDFIVTIYLTVLSGATQSGICPQLQWTDEGGPQQLSKISPDPQPPYLDCSYQAGRGATVNEEGPVALSLPIHVLANTPVTVSLVLGYPGEAVTYNLRVGKIKLNP